MLVQIVADAIKNDDGVVDGVTHNAEERRHEERVDLEGRELSQQREDADRDEDVVEERDDGDDAETHGTEAARHFAKRQGDVEDDGDGREEKSVHGSALEAGAHRGSDGRELKFLQFAAE